MNQFSIDYAEYHIAGQLQHDFPKADNFAVNIPLSRQQKYFDLLLYNGNNKRSLAIQVKSSRTYILPDADPATNCNYYVWLNNFSIKDNYSDFYFIFISYPHFDSKTFKPKAAFGTKVLVFDSHEMANLLANIKVTKKGHPDRFFAFGFNIDDNRIFGERGFSKDPKPDFTSNLYANKLAAINNAIKGAN